MGNPSPWGVEYFPREKGDLATEVTEARRKVKKWSNAINTIAPLWNHYSINPTLHSFEHSLRSSAANKIFRLSLSFHSEFSVYSVANNLFYSFSLLFFI